MTILAAAAEGHVVSNTACNIGSDLSRLPDRTEVHQTVTCQRPPAMDLRGPKVSAMSLTARSTNLTEDDVVDPQSSRFSSAAVLALMFLFLAVGPPPAYLRLPPVETRDSGCGKEVVEPTLCSCPLGPGAGGRAMTFPWQIQIDVGLPCHRVYFS